MNEQFDLPPLWQWTEDNSPVDQSAFILKKWKHSGDSPIALARPRKRRGVPTPPPAYLLKWGRDAIGERLYSLVAHHLRLPSAVVCWSASPDLPEAAIRFEPEAWRPDTIDPATGVASSEERTVLLQNPLDYYRHLALSEVLGEVDGVEFMVCQEVLFRIEAASVGWTLFSSALNRLFRRGEERTTEQSIRPFRATAADLRHQAPQGYRPYLDTLEQVAAATELPERVAEDLRTCPATNALLFPASLGASVLGGVPSLSLLADVAMRSLCQQQQAIQHLLAEQ